MIEMNQAKNRNNLIIRLRKVALSVSFLLLSLIIKAQTVPPTGHPYYFLDTEVLRKVKAAFEKGTIADHPAIKELFRKAGSLLNKAPLTITSSGVMPPNGDKHEYYSMARYWWPDPNQPDGLPYIRKDGRTNPEINWLPDHKLLDEMVGSVQTLSYAYFLSGQEKYAAKAMAFLHTWFIDTSTRMNPDLNYAQVVKGRGAGRSSGILDARSLARVPDALQLLSSSAQYKPADIAAISNWFREYIRWLTTSKQGRGEAAAKNNHFTWYLVQALPLSDFAGDKALTKTLLELARTAVLGHVKPDGTQPEELARTNSLGYSVFNLSACMQLFTVCAHLGENNWQYVSPDGQSLKKCIDFLAPYISGQKSWPYQQIHPYHFADAYPLYLQAALIYNDPRYWEIVHRFQDTGREQQIEYLLWGYLPSGSLQ